MKQFYLTILLFSFYISQAQNEQWKYLRPSNTGLGGDYHLCIKDDACGNIWTGGYLPFWSEGSLVRFDGTKFTNWSNFEGYLPADRVYDLAFDSNGEIWVATNDVGNDVEHGGISHYDGNQWTTYTSANSPLPQDDMRSIAIDSQDNVWATFWNTAEGIGGVCKFDGTNWTIYLPGAQSLPTYRVDKIAIDELDQVWVGTDFGLAKFDGTTWTTYDQNNSGLTNYAIKDVEFDKTTNKLYVVTGNSINIFDGTSWTHIDSTNSPIASNNLWAVDAQGDKVIVATLGGTYLTYVFDGTNWSNHQEPDHTYDVRIDDNGNFWTAGIGVVMKFDGTTWTTYNSKNTGLTSMFNDDIYVDSSDHAWLASNDNGGINRFDCPTWQDYNPYNAGLWPSPINYTGSGSGITEDSLGDIWMVYSGTLGGVVQMPMGDVTNPSAWTIWENDNSGISLQFLKRAAGDQSGNVWFGYEGACSVSKYSHSTNSWTNYNLYQLGQVGCGAGSGIKSIKVDPDNNVWICGNAGLAKYDQTTWTFYSPSNSPLPDGIVMDIAFDADGNKWIATQYGLFRFDGTNWTVYNTTNSGLLGNFISCVWVDASGKVWAGSKNPDVFPQVGGLVSFDGTTWTSYTTANSGLQEKFIDRISADSSGNLWLMSATKGVSIFNPGGVAGYSCLDKVFIPCGSLAVNQFYNNKSNNLIAFPKPASGNATIAFTLQTAQKIQITITDVMGKTVLQPKAQNLDVGNQKINIDISKLQKGIYFCTLQSAANRQTCKIIKI